MLVKTILLWFPSGVVEEGPSAVNISFSSSYSKQKWIVFDGVPLSPNNMDTDLNIRSIFTSAKIQRNELESSSEPTSPAYQENLQAAIKSLEECRNIAGRISLFSPNETEDDISSGDLQ